MHMRTYLNVAETGEVLSVPGNDNRAPGIYTLEEVLLNLSMCVCVCVCVCVHTYTCMHCINTLQDVLLGLSTGRRAHMCTFIHGDDKRLTYIHE